MAFDALPVKSTCFIFRVKTFCERGCVVDANNLSTVWPHRRTTAARQGFFLQGGFSLEEQFRDRPQRMHSGPVRGEFMSLPYARKRKKWEATSHRGAALEHTQKKGFRRRPWLLTCCRRSHPSPVFAELPLSVPWSELSPSPSVWSRPRLLMSYVWRCAVKLSITSYLSKGEGYT